MQVNFFPAVPFQKTTFIPPNISGGCPHALWSLFYEIAIHPSLALHINF
jgi:hypothetical protein